VFKTALILSLIVLTGCSTEFDRSLKQSNEFKKEHYENLELSQCSTIMKEMITESINSKRHVFVDCMKFEDKKRT
jgi:hypothetical protein